MKKIYLYISILTLTVLAAGCAEELVNPDEGLTTDSKLNEQGEISFVLSVPASADTRTVLGVRDGSTYPVFWSEDDVIALNGSEAVTFVTGDDKATATAVFKPTTLAAPYNFLYCGVPGTDNQVSFPAAQVYVEGGFGPAAMPMYASLASRGDNVTFSHVGSLLRFSFTGDRKISSITLNAADEKMALSGIFTIGTTEGLLDGTLTPAAPGTGLTYSFGEAVRLSNTPFVFYIAIPSGTYAGGITLDVVDSEAGHMTVKIMGTPETETIAAGKVREFDNVVYVADKEENLIRIHDASSLLMFADRVAAGENSLNARIVSADVVLDASSLAETWTPIDSYKGTFDGNGRTISGLTQPLFGTLGGVVKNLTLNSVIIATSADDVEWGMFAKLVYPSSEIDDIAGLLNCVAQGSITYAPAAALSQECKLGGLVGNNRGGAIVGCTNEAVVTMAYNGQTNVGQVSIGGVVGRTQKGGELNLQGDISDCTNKGTVACNATLSDNLYIGGVLGYQVEKAESISSCINNGIVKIGATFSTSKSLQLGGVIGMGNGIIDSCSNGSEGVVTSEVGAVAGNNGSYYICQGGVIGRLNADGGTYSGLSNAGTLNVGANGDRAWIGGVIGRCNEGALLQGLTNSGSINVAAESTDDTFIGGVTARVQHSISDCHSTGGVITYTGTSIPAPLYIGGVIGFTNDAVKISNCSSAMTLDVRGAFSPSSDSFFGTGGVIGGANSNDAFLENCTNTGDVIWSQEISSKGYSFLGGVAGRSQGVISGCKNSGTVTYSGKNSAQNPYIGGIVGTNTDVSGDRIYNCTNSGTIMIDTSVQLYKGVYVGGIAGRSYGTMTAINTGTVQVPMITCRNLYLGGLAGQNNGTIAGGSKNAASGDITISGLTSNEQSYIGGIAGQSSGAISATNDGDLVLTDGSKASKDLSIGGVVGETSSALTSCVNNGVVSNAVDSGAGIFIGGVAGKSQNGTYVKCRNSGKVSNTGKAGNTGESCYLAVAGLVGYLNGDNILTGTSAEYNHNTGAVEETSATEYVGVGGIAGLVKGAGSNLMYAKNDGNIYFAENTRKKSYVGGVVGCAQTVLSMDYTSNSGNLTFRNLTISGIIVIGGVLGGFYNDESSYDKGDGVNQNAPCTIKGCVNTGAIDCADKSGNGSNMASTSSATTPSFVGGISGVGFCYYKTFINCRNTGSINVYNQLRTCLGGVLGYTDVNPTGSVCDIGGSRIVYYRYKGGYQSGNGSIGGVVGYCNIPEFNDLTFIGGLQTTGSSPNCYTGGIIGQAFQNGVFSNCKVGHESQNIVGASSGKLAPNATTGAGLFTSSSKALDFSFPDCIVADGVKCQGIAVTDSNLGSAVVGRYIGNNTSLPKIGSF